MKSVFIFGIIVFEFGSLLCTLATSSKMFVLGRAIAGLGSSAMGIGAVKMLRHLFPLSKQALWLGVIGSIQSVGLVAAPVIGGGLIDVFSWRACFGINLPLGVFCVAFTAYGFHDPVSNSEIDLPLWEKVKRTNPLGTLLIVPALTCFLMALQLGGSTYGWGNWRIILMFILFGVLLSAFGYLQYRQGEEATLPIRILRKRSILAGLWYSACCDGILAVTESYISIYFQGVRGYTATKSGLLGVPMIVGLFIAIMVAATGTTKIGYYFRKPLPCVARLILTQTLSLHVRNQCFSSYCIWAPHNHQYRPERWQSFCFVRLPWCGHRFRHTRPTAWRDSLLIDRGYIDWYCCHNFWGRYGLCYFRICVFYTVPQSPHR
jgi:MFS family permease